MLTLQRSIYTFMIVFFGAVAGSAEAPKVLLSCSPSQAGTKITIGYAAPLIADYSLKGNDVLLQFGQGFALYGLPKAHDCGSLLRGIQYGYNSLLISTAPASIVKVNGTKVAGYRILVTGKTESAGESRERTLLEARARYEIGETGEAVGMLREGLASDPGDESLLQTLGSYEAASGRTLPALRALREWARTNPEAARNDQLYQELQAPYRPAFSAGYEYLDGEDSFTQRRFATGFRAPLRDDAPAPMIGGRVEWNDAEFSSLRTPEGTIEDRTVDKERFELFSSYPFLESEGRFALRATDYAVGASVDLDMLDENGKTSFFGQINDPTWEYASSIAFEGTRDRIGLRREQRFDPRFRAALGAAYSQYSLDDVSTAAESIGVNGGAVYTVVDDLPRVELSYRFNGDYFLDIEERTTSTGEDYRVFSAQTTEYHTFSMGVSQRFTPSGFRGYWSVYGFGGYAFDRLGENAPEAGLGTRTEWWDGPGFSLEVGRSFTTVGGADSQTRIIGSFDWKL